MKRLTLSIALFVLLPWVSMAQPPEEIPPPPPGTDEFTEVTPVGPAQPQPVAPVAEPIAPDLPGPEDDDEDVSGMKVFPGFGLYPFGYDSINVGGAEGGRYYIEFYPSIGVSNKFKTDKGNLIEFNAAYELHYREYYNKDTTNRDFENDLSGGVSIPWSPRLTTNLGAFFAYFFKSGADTNGDNAIWLESDDHLAIKVNDKFSLKAGLFFYYLNFLDWNIDPGDINSSTGIPGDIDDLRAGIGSGGTGFGSFGAPGVFGVGPSSGFVSQDLTEENRWVSNLGPVIGLKYNPLIGTSLKLDYRFLPVGFSNDDNLIWHGHWIKTSIFQDLPWKGGTLGFMYYLRMRSYDYQTNASGEYRFDYRNRLSFLITQTINPYMTYKAYYRLQLYGASTSDYNIDPVHWFYTGMDFSF